MTVYIDSEFRCHVKSDDGLRPVEAELFDGKCAAFIEGYRFVPYGESWMRADGIVFRGQMIAPAEDYSRLEKAQQQYDEDEAAYLVELGSLIEDLYNADLEVIG